MLNAFLQLINKNALMTAARSGNSEGVDRLCSSCSNIITSEILGKALIEAGKNKQTALMKHIFYRVNYGGGYPQNLTELHWNTAIFECLKADCFDLVEIFYNFEWQHIILPFCVNKMIEENWNIEKVNMFMKNFCQRECNPCLSQEFVDACQQHGMVGTAILKAAKESVIDEMLHRRIV